MSTLDRGRASIVVMAASSLPRIDLGAPYHTLGRASPCLAPCIQGPPTENACMSPLHFVRFQLFFGWRRLRTSTIQSRVAPLSNGRPPLDRTGRPPRTIASRRDTAMGMSATQPTECFVVAPGRTIDSSPAATDRLLIDIDWDNVAPIGQSRTRDSHLSGIRLVLLISSRPPAVLTG